MTIYLGKYQRTALGKHAKAAHESNLKRLENNTRLHSLYSRGDEGHADHHQVQNIEIVPAEGAFMEECSIGGHLSGSKVTRLTAKRQNWQIWVNVWALPLEWSLWWRAQWRHGLHSRGSAKRSPWFLLSAFRQTKSVTSLRSKIINPDSTSSWGGGWQIIVTLKCQTEVMEGQLPLVQRVQLRLAKIKSNSQTWITY